MPSSSEIILSNQTHVGDSTLQSVSGDKYKGDGYYGRSDGFHTVQYTVEGFIGTIKMQGTLALEPVDADWFYITDAEHSSSSTSSSNANGSFLYNFTGNYVYVRAVIEDWTDGSVGKVQLNH